MASRFNGLKTGQHRSVRAGCGQMSGARVAAKVADINAFANLMREKKRISERSGDQQAAISTVDRDQSATSSWVAGPDSYLVNQLQRTPDVTAQTSVASFGHEQVLSLSVSSNRADGPASTDMQKIIESVVTVVERMIMNHDTNTDPRQWNIQLGIDGLDVMEMSVIYLGKDEWRLEFFNDQNAKRPDADTDELYSLVENIEAVLPDLEAALQKARPGLRLQTAVIERRDV